MLVVDRFDAVEVHDEHAAFDERLDHLVEGGGRDAVREIVRRAAGSQPVEDGRGLVEQRVRLDEVGRSRARIGLGDARIRGKTDPVGVLVDRREGSRE